MISAELHTSFGSDVDIDIIRWCNKNIGICALGRDSVTKMHPWFLTCGFFDSTWHFANKDDAVAFKLRWL